MTHHRLHLIALAGLPIIGLTLWAWGQPLICTCGDICLRVSSIVDRGNSQHIAPVQAIDDWQQELNPRNVDPEYTLPDAEAPTD